MSLSIEEIEKKLNTSAASGLSRKAAKVRLQKTGENTFFLFQHASAIDCLRTTISQPSIILLFLLGLLLLAFQQQLQGRALLILTSLYVAILCIMRLWCGRISRIPARTMRPYVRVIREGQMFLLDCTRLVPGDLIELEQGDMVPCDLRMVTAHELRVLTYLGQAGNGNYIRTYKGISNDGIAYSPDICEHSNMLYGGSMIESGHVRALVVETGKHTYIGALQGGFLLMFNQTLPQTAKRMKKTATYLQIALLLAILPVLCICLLIGKTEEGLPMLFSTLLCLCLANLSGHMDTILDIGMAMGIHRAFSANPSEQTALIKTDKSPEQLTQFDILLLFGSQAFSEQMITSEASPHLVQSRESEDVRRRREMKMALGENFLCSREEDLCQLRKAGITPILLIEEESSQSITYIMRTGIAENVSEIAMASQFRQQHLPITHEWGKYSAYCGFSNEELKILLIHLKKAKKRIAILANLPHETAIWKQADVRFACVDDMSLFTDSHRTLEKKPRVSRGRDDVATQRMRRHADVLIPCADRYKGGLASILQTLYTAADTNRNLTSMANYLICAQVVRMTMILPTMFVGIPMVSPIQVLFSGFCLDLMFAWMLLTRVWPQEPQKIRSLSYYSWKLTVIEAVFSATLTLVAFLFIHHNYPDPIAAAPSLLIAMILIQITSFLWFWNPIVSLRFAFNRKTLLYTIVGLLIFLLLLWVLGLSSHLGLQAISAPYSYLLLIGPLAVILVTVVTRMYQSGRLR